MQEPYSNIRQAIDELLNVKSSVKRKKVITKHEATIH
jgi:hypothetical protein